MTQLADGKLQEMQQDNKSKRNTSAKKEKSMNTNYDCKLTSLDQDPFLESAQTDPKSWITDQRVFEEFAEIREEQEINEEELPWEKQSTVKLNKL